MNPIQLQKAKTAPAFALVATDPQLEGAMLAHEHMTHFQGVMQSHLQLF